MALGLFCLSLAGGAVRAAHANDLALQPLPPKIVFPDPQENEPRTFEDISAVLESSFADLNKVVVARQRLVRRFGVVSTSRLVHALRGGDRSVSQPHAWNAALTLAALRDTHGPSPAVQRSLPALLKMLQAGGEANGRAFAALAIGCFPWTEGAEPPDIPAQPTVPGPRAHRKRVRQVLADALDELVRHAADPQDSGMLARASLLALAKVGGAKAEHEIRNINPNTGRSRAPYRQALLVARSLARAHDPAPLLTGLHDERVVAVAASLSLAISLVIEEAPDWTHDYQRLNAALVESAFPSRSKDEVAARLFARGMNALVNAAPESKWRKIWSTATHATVEEPVSVAGAQVMLFCKQRWFHDEMVLWASRPPNPLRDAVRSMVLLRAGELATERAVQACIEWVRVRSKSPKPAQDWDPRWYALVGLLRSLHHQRLTDPALREQVVDALDWTRRNVLKPSPTRDALERVLKQYGKVLRGSSALPAAALAEVEGSLPDRFGLLAKDPREVCAHRVNELVEEVFQFGSIVPSKAGDPQKSLQGARYLKAYLDAYPYFSRLHFQVRRGTRPFLRIDPDAREGLNK